MDFEVPGVEIKYLVRLTVPEQHTLNFSSRMRPKCSLIFLISHQYSIPISLRKFLGIPHRLVFSHFLGQNGEDFFMYIIA